MATHVSNSVCHGCELYSRPRQKEEECPVANVSQKDERVICLVLVSLSYICAALHNKLTFTVAYWVQNLALEYKPWTQLRDETTRLFKAPGLLYILRTLCVLARLVARNKQSRHPDLRAN